MRAGAHPDIHLEWGLRGVREGVRRGDILVLVDVLSFSSTVVTALHYGAVVYPHSKNGQAPSYADRLGAQLILGRAEAAADGQPTLSPVSFGPEHRGQRYVLCSLNGAACCEAALQADAPAVLIGGLLNVRAAAVAADRLRARLGCGVTVVACGEQWPDAAAGEERLRPALEDLLGAAAIVRSLRGSRSPDAAAAVRMLPPDARMLAAWLHGCPSGQELRARGFAADVAHSAQLDAFRVVPQLDRRTGGFIAF